MKTYLITINNANNSGIEAAYIVQADGPLAAFERAFNYCDTSSSTVKSASLKIASEGDKGAYLPGDNAK